MLDKIKAFVAKVKAAWDKVVSLVATYPQVSFVLFMVAVYLVFRYR